MSQQETAEYAAGNTYRDKGGKPGPDLREMLSEAVNTA